EERGRDSEVVRRAPSTTQRALYRRERLRIIIVPAHVLEQGQKMVEGTLAVDTARSFYAFCHALVQTGQAPLREGDADYRDPKGAAFHHRIKRRKNHFVGEIARHPEEYQRVRMGGFHQSSPSLAAGFFSMPPNGLVFFSQRREPPTNAFRLSPMRVSGGRSLMCLAFPPPNTTYSGSSACLRRSTTSPTSITRTLLTFWEAALIASSRCDHRTRIAWRRAACRRSLLRLSMRTAGKVRRSRPEREPPRRWRR